MNLRSILAFAALLALAHAFKLSPKPILASPDAGSNVSEARPEEAAASAPVAAQIDTSKGESPSN